MTAIIAAFLVVIVLAIIIAMVASRTIDEADKLASEHEEL